MRPGIAQLGAVLITSDVQHRDRASFLEANRPRYTKRRHAFAGLVSCGRCGCAMTAEIKKGRWLYYHCTGGRGACGNTYVREEELSRLFADVVKRVQVPIDVATPRAARDD